MTDTISRSDTPTVERTAPEHGEHGFRASQELSESLQAVLIDLIELSLQGKQAHWNIVGPNFRDLHLQLDEIVEAARGFADDVAERMRSVHASADGRSAVVSGTTTLEEFPGGEQVTTEVVDWITTRLDATVATCRRVHDVVDDEDPTSADLLHTVIDRLEQLSWMVSAEHRTPRRATSRKAS